MLNVPQDTVGPFDHQGTLLTHIELTINQTPQIPFCRAALQLLVPRSRSTSRISPTQVQNPFLYVKFHTVGHCPTLIYKNFSARPPYPQGNQQVLLVEYRQQTCFCVLNACAKVIDKKLKVEPWGTLLVTCSQPGVIPFT